jgi:prolyl oligopeptidase PreP (S9A serine peptidase family)
MHSIGLLVAACANRAPQGTFGAAVAEVGVLDMLKVTCLRTLPWILGN